MTGVEPPVAARHHGPLRAWRTRIAYGLAALTAYALFGFFAVPWIVRSQLTSRARTMLHREATVARVRFNPFTLTGIVEGLELKDRDGGPLFKLARLTATVQLRGVFRRALQLREVMLERPEATLRILADGHLSLADLFEPDPAAAEGNKTKMLRTRIGRLAIAGGRFDFIDESRTPRFVESLAPLDVTIHGLTTVPNESGDHSVTIGIGDKTRLHWSGRQSARPIHLEGHLELTDLALPKLWDYAADRQPVALRDGRADIAGSYELSYDGDRGFSLAVKDGQLALRDVALRPRGGDEDWLTVPTARVDGIGLRWPESRLDIGAIAVGNPSAVVRFDKQGQVNWASAFTVFGEKRAARLSAKDAKPWAVQVGAVDLVKGTARVEDQQLDPAMAVALDQLALRLEHLSSDLKSPVTARASVRINDAGVATANGTVVPDPLSAALDVAVSGLNLAPFWRYAKVSTADLRGGAAGAHGKVLIAPGSPRVRFDGEAVLDGLELVDESASRVVAWKQSLAKGVRLTVAPGRLRIAEVVLDQGFIKTLIDRQGNLNLTRLAGGASAPSSATSSPKPAASSSSGASFPVDVTTISIRDAKIDYGDESLILPFGTDIHAANGTIKDLSTTSAAPARLALEGRVAETGYVKVAGTLRVADPLAATEIDVTFRDVSMPALTPYVAQFAGYAVQDGHLDLDVHYRIVDRRLLGDHRVVAKDLVLGPKVEGASGPPLPLRLAIALLKDKDGRVDLEVPIEGSVDAPEFAYRKVFWQAVRKILANVALAPFRAIGRMFGRDDEDLDLVGFASGRSDLLPPEQETLAKLAAELAKRPGVTIEVEGRFDPVADVVAIRRARLEARIDAKRGSQENLEAILEALYVETFSPDRLETERGKFAAATFDAAGFYDALRAQLLEHETVGAPELAALGHARAAAIAGTLTAPGGLDATRVTTKDPAPVSRKKRGSDLVASQMAMSAND